MQKYVFKELFTTLKSSYGLKECTNVSIVEALAMFLIILEHGFSNRMVQEIFQYSGETVTRWFDIVLECNFSHGC